MLDDTARPGSWSTWSSEQQPPRLGVSGCLLGENVRYDGGHARDRYVSGTLAEWFELVSVCPEVEVGMTIPRPTIRLDDSSGEPRLIAPSTGEDFTDAMSEYSKRRVDELRALDLDGFVLKRGSPSCGLERVKVYRGVGSARRDGVGSFATVLLERWPELPVEEEGRLNDALLREHFVERIFAHNRWRVFLANEPTRRALVEFHTAHKLLLRTHDEHGYRELGRIVGSAGTCSDEELIERYGREYHNVLSKRATIKRHVNVMQHAMGYLKTLLNPIEKQELLRSIEDYRKGLLPLIVPLTLLRFNIARHEIEYLTGQVYFEPHPKELMLRNHA